MENFRLFNDTLKTIPEQFGSQDNFLNDSRAKIPEYNQSQENLLNVYKRENQALKTMIHHYEETLKCRENLMSQYISELQTLKKTIQQQKKTIAALNLEIDSFKNEKFFKERAPQLEKNKKSRPIQSAKSVKCEHLYMKKPIVQTVTKSQGIGVNTANLFQENDKFYSVFTAGFQKMITKQRYRKIEELSKCKGDFFSSFNTLNFVDREEIIENAVACFIELMAYSKINFKLKGVINIYRNISKLSKLEDILLMINRELPFLFNCYKSHLYLLDEYANELWTPLEEPEKHLKLPLDVKDNAVVYAAINDKIIRIDNAQNDLIFSRNLDNEKNLKIKNILCYPIKNKDEKFFAVIELLNKHEGTFSNEDEDFLNLISSQISALISQFIESERLAIKLTKVTNLINLTSDLQNFETLEDVIKNAEERINELMGTEICSVVFVDYVNNCFVKLLNNQRKIIPDLKVGIIGKALNTVSVIETKNVKNDPDFNYCIDNQTELPMLTFPVKYGEKIVAIVQMIHLRRKIGERFLKKSLFWGNEFLDYFSKLLGFLFKGIRN